MRKLLLSSAALGLIALAVPASAQAVDTKALPPRDVSFSFEGPFGMFNRADLQHGFQVYKEVCSACHALSHVAFHNLDEEGGPGFTEPQAKAIAAGYKVPAGPNDKGETTDDKGQPLMRPAILADYFPAPFANDEAARASNGGALPPDLSMVVKAREGGPQYVYSIVTGDGSPVPAGFHVTDGKYYDPYFEGRNISMPPPLKANSVTYSDGTKATVEQEAHDVVTFLSWASEPKLEERRAFGLGAMIYLFIFTGLLYASYRRIWRNVAH